MKHYIKRAFWHRAAFLLIFTVFVLCAVQILTSTAHATYSSQITIVPYDTNVWNIGTADDINAALYPSGMQLPTKYMDFLDFSFISTEFSVSNEVGTFLNRYWPEQRGRFTNAEYMAARRFIYLLRTYNTFGEAHPIIKGCARLQHDSSWALLMNFSNVSLSGAKLDTLKDYVSYYWEVLAGTGAITSGAGDESLYAEFTQSTINGVYMTVGSAVQWDTYTADYNPLTDCGEDLSNYLANFVSYANAFGLTFTDTICSGAVSGTGEVILLDTNGEDLEGNNLGEFFETTPQLPGQELLHPEDGTTVRPNRPSDSAISDVGEHQSDGESDIATGQLQGDTLVQFPDYIPIDESATSATKLYNLRDVAGIGALIFIFVALIVLWILHTIRRHHDPIHRRWR